MADHSLIDGGIPHATSPTPDARLYVVDDPSGTPADGYLELQDLIATGAGGVFRGVVLTRLQNLLADTNGGTGVAEPVPFTDVWDNSNETLVEWDIGAPADLVVTVDGWYWAGANVTTLGTGYTDGTDNSDLTISILKNYPGTGPILDYMVSVDRFHNVQTTSAQCNSLPPKPLYLVAGDVIQLAILNNIVSTTLLESNPGPALPGGGESGTGPGTLGPHLYVIGVPASAVGPTGPAGAGGVLFASSGDPNDDVTVPSPPDDLRSRAYNVDDDDRLWRWGLPDGSTDVDPFTGSDGTNLLTSYTGPNGETYTGTGAGTPAWAIASNTAAGGGDVFHSWMGRDMGSADGTVSAVLGTIGPGDRNGLGLRHVDFDSYVSVYTDGTDIHLAIVDLGSFAVINTWSGAGTSPAGKVLEVEMVGNVYTVTFDAVLLGSFTDTGNNYLTATEHGVTTYQGATTFDDLSWTSAGLTEEWVATDFQLGSPI